MAKYRIGTGLSALSPSAQISGQARANVTAAAAREGGWEMEERRRNPNRNTRSTRPEYYRPGGTNPNNPRYRNKNNTGSINVANGAKSTGGKNLMPWERGKELEEAAGGEMAWERFQSKGDTVDFGRWNTQVRAGESAPTPPKLAEARDKQAPGSFERGKMQGARIRARLRSRESKIKEREKKKAVNVGNSGTPNKVNSRESR